MTDLQQFVQHAKAVHRAPIEPLPEIKPHETFAYAAGNLRDPFAPLLFNQPRPTQASGKGTGPKPIPGRPHEPLESFPLDSLRMVGILKQNGSTWALVKAGDGTIHRVTVGNYMGQNDGKIIRIAENEVDLVEIVPNGLGDYRERSASLALNTQ